MFEALAEAEPTKAEADTGPEAATTDEVVSGSDAEPEAIAGAANEPEALATTADPLAKFEAPVRAERLAKFDALTTDPLVE